MKRPSDETHDESLRESDKVQRNGETPAFEERARGAVDDRPSDTVVSDGEQAPEAEVFPIVGIGASAGGLKAYEVLIAALPPDTGMAFVLVQHLAPDHQSELSSLLQNHTEMKITQVAEATEVARNCIYVIPPAKNLSLRNGVLHLSDPTSERGQRSPIDHFLRTLAEDRSDRAIGVILSGTGSDGTLGMKAIKEKAGFCMAQDPSTSEYDGMPRSAIATGIVDVVAPVEELADRLANYQVEEQSSRLSDKVDALPEGDAEALGRIFATMEGQKNVDFSEYKKTTLLRRVGRRMQVNRIETLSAYAQFVEKNPSEPEALFRDLLISVTNFFRDPASFEALETQVIPKIFEDKDASDQVRVWVPGCATGEEAYSIAMLLLEHAATLDAPPDIQIFATDLDTEALQFARQGLYPKSIAPDVSPERRHRFFDLQDDGYHVAQPLSDAVLFAEHNLMKDPPFSDLDLVSCRNLLIYIRREMQERIYEVFHYALRDEGVLFTGSSESPDSISTLFRTLDEKHHIYGVRELAERPKTMFTPAPSVGNPETRTPSTGSGRIPSKTSIETVHQQVLLGQHTPPSVLVNEQYEIVHMHGNIGQFLKINEGTPTYNVLQMVDRSTRLELRPALFRIFQKHESSITRRYGMMDEEMLTQVTVERAEHAEMSDPHALILFSRVKRDAPGSYPDQDDEASNQALIEHLEEDLKRTKERLHTVTEEYETTNEELKASNEELQSMNEELRSTAEELETSREELQSTNEELITVNDELKSKIKEVNQANADLKNLLASTEIGTIFLDLDLQLQRYTPRATDVYNVIPGDIGRPLSHLSHRFEDVDIVGDAQQVLDALEPLRRELKTGDTYYMMRVLPYRTEGGSVDGIVLTFIDITERKKAELAVQRQAEQQQTVADLGVRAIEFDDPDPFKEVAVQDVADTLGVPYVSLVRYHPSDNTMTMEVAVGPDRQVVEASEFPATRNFPSGYALHTEAPVMAQRLGSDPRFDPPPHLEEEDLQSCLSVPIRNEDVPYGVLNIYTTEDADFSDNDVHFLQSVANLLGGAINRNRAEAALRRSKEEAEAASKAKSAFVANVSHDLRTPLTSLLGGARLVEQIIDEEHREVVDLIKTSGKQLQDMVNSVVDYLEAGETSAQLELRPVDLTDAVEEMLTTFRHQVEADGLDFHVNLEADDLWSRVDATALRRVISNLVDNAVKYTESGSVTIELAREQTNDASTAVLVVEDTGTGMSKEFQKRAFDAFEQETMGETRTHSGNGLGLAIVQEMVTAMNGTVRLTSAPGEGTRVELSFPWLPPDERSSSTADPAIVTHIRTDDDVDSAPLDEEDAGTEPLSEHITPCVFVVEDTEETRKLLEMVLESECRLEMTATYDAALERARRMVSEEIQPDVLLLDIHLGDSRTGVDLLHELCAEIDGFDDVPAIACTAFARSSDRERYLNQGFDAYLHKPFGTDELFRVLRRMIRAGEDG